LKGYKEEKYMVTAAAKIKLYAPWVRSLKDKRSIVKSILAKLRDRFNVSVCEAEEQDVHQTIVIGFALAASSEKTANDLFNSVIRFIENNSEADVVEIVRI
jgi:uncharacterized protein YlxP (DUF503 family)